MPRIGARVGIPNYQIMNLYQMGDGSLERALEYEIEFMKSKILGAIGEILLSGGKWAVEVHGITSLPTLVDNPGKYFEMYAEVKAVHSLDVVDVGMPKLPVPKLELNVDVNKNQLFEWQCEYCGRNYEPKDHRYCPRCGGGRPVIQEVINEDRN